MGWVAAHPGPVNPSTRRWVLWGALVLLIACLLTILVWLAGRYEASQLQRPA
jgi:two-component system sensor histidine kinase DctS